MMRSLSPLLRSSLAVLLLSPSFGSIQAAAQVLNAAAVSGAPAVSGVAGAAARAPLAIGGLTTQVPSQPINFAPSLDVLPALAPSALKAVPAASQVAPALEAAAAASASAVPAISVRTAADSEAPAARGAATAALSGAFRSDPRSTDAPAGAEARIDILFDGGTRGRAVDGTAPVDAGLPALGAASILAKYAAAAPAISKAAPPAAAKMKRAGRSFGLKALVAAAILIATPGLALAATAAGPAVAVAGASLAFLASIQPLASAAGAMAGAIYGMIAARPKDGSAVSSGEVLASILRYGVLGGAGAYILFDLTQIIFVGASAVGLQPLASAIAIAALGRTAFQDKFTAPATTSADRIMGAFPAVAAAVGLSVGVVMTALAAPALSFVIATGAMAATGIATAIYAATYKPGRSPADGPAMMAKGYVLQALMMGLALAVSNPFLFWPFAALGAAGFALVLWATARQIWSLRPGAPAQPLPPVTPKPAPPSTPPANPKI
jgi:hypothetical protein